MADEKISAMPSGAPAQGTDPIAIGRTGGTVLSLTVADLLNNDVHAGYSEYTGQASDPVAPTSAVRIYTRSLGGRYVPRWIGPSGLDTAFQPALFANNVTMWMPTTSTTAFVYFGISWTVATTQATPSIANTNFMTAMKRATFTTTTTASNTSGVRTASPIVWIGNIAGAGGFFFAARFGILTYVSTMRVLVGLSALTTALATDPSSTANTCGMSKDSGETTWQCITVDSTGGAGHFTKVSSGRTTQAAGTSNIFDFYMFCKPNDTQISFRITDVTTGTNLVNNSSITTTLPTSSQMLTAHAEWALGATGGVACAGFLNKIYIESDT